ncbi:Wadjet anti-phage system protein JetD domain-containing protein (plasmid) [Cupriavidus basilensis]
MNWTCAADLRAQLQKQWDRGTMLGSLASGEPLFPMRLILKCPSSAEVTEHFDAVRGWIAALREMPYCRLEMREFRHRVFGNNAIPEQAWIDTLDDAAVLLGKRNDVKCFTALLDATRVTQPELLAWLARRPLRALELADAWPRLLAIVGWLQAHPRPGIYLRQVDIAGVHSKLIEQHRGTLAELLDIVLPAAAVDPACSGIQQFAGRYGFLDKPMRIRFRMLDPERALLPGGHGGEDITLDATSFARLDPGVSRVFITENEINFLAFPQVADSLILFGAGYGFDMLPAAPWLARCRIHYWGDIDTHGFAILDQLRSRLAHVESFLMDRGTLMAFEALWGEEESPTKRELPRLTADEQSVFDDLRDNRIRKNLRLEQERIGYGWVEGALGVLV